MTNQEPKFHHFNKHCKEAASNLNCSTETYTEALRKDREEYNKEMTVRSSECTSVQTMEFIN